MAVAGQPIEAVLTLNATGFHTGISEATSAVKNFTKSIDVIKKDSSRIGSAIGQLQSALIEGKDAINEFNASVGKTTNFNNFAQAINRIANALKILSGSEIDAVQSTEMINNMFRAFKGALEGIEVKVSGVSSSLKKLVQDENNAVSSIELMKNAFNEAKQSLMNMAGSEEAIARIKQQIASMNAEFERSKAELLEFANTGVQAFHSVDASSDSLKAQIASMNAEFERSRTELLNFANGGVEAFNKVRAGIASALDGTSSIINSQSGHFARLKSEIDQTSNSYRMLRINAEGENVTLEKSSQALAKNSAEMTKNAQAKLRAMGYTGQFSSSTDKSTSSIQRQARASSTATARTNQLSSATSRLGKAMSSLRMMGSLVGSMLAYNFAHKLLVATGETIHAKSEMEGYFKMLNFGQGEINSFNQALDRTVAQFQRVNKYSLGETISSIGVEFNLSTQEMEKAMKVTSMITSEYLRAGRNANEASLAVKDVLQGQFQRLSRETGVKGEDLKEAGWSGDTKDVLGLMKALEKVGQSRNWDVFAEKANSLNDILTITQNRFGEWSADMVNKVQPAIVGAFNMIMGTAQKLGGVLGGVVDWLGGDGIENNIAKWGLLATAITGVLSVIVSYRTGAGLLQVAQMGLSKTIASTVLGLNAETVAMYGTRTAIASKIFGLEAEKIATLSTKDAILSKVLGLDAELVAQTSLRQGILDKAFAQELETLRLSGATKEEMLNTLALYENQLAQKSTIGLLSAQAMGLNMTTYAQHGFTVALLEAKTGMDATKIASMGLAKKIALLGASMIAPTALVGAFAVGIGILAFKMNDSAKAMERFNDILENGEKTVKENRETVQTYTDRLSHLKEELAKTKEGSLEYNQIQEQINATNKDLEVSNANVENSYKALQMAVSAKGNFEQAKTDMTIKKQGELAQAYMDAGYSMAEAYEMANTSLIDAEQGAEQLRQTLQKLAMIDYKNVENVNYLLSQFEDSGVDPEVGKKYLEQSTSLHDRMKQGMEKGMTDESFMGRLDGWLTYYESQILNWTNNIGAMLETNDWGKVWDNVWKGMAHGVADLPFIKDFWSWAGKQINFDPTGELKGSGWDGLNKMLGRFFPTSESIGLESITESFDNNIKQPIMDWWNGFSSFEWLGSLTNFDLFGKLFDAILPQGVSASDGSSDHPSFMEDLNAIFGVDIQTWVTNFMADPMGTLGIDLSGFDIFGALTNFIFGSGGTEESGDSSWINNILPPISLETITSWVTTNLTDPLSQALWTGITSIPLVSDILQLFGLVNGENSGSSQKGSDLGNSFKTAIENVVRNIPILGDVLQMLGVIPQANPTASSNGQGVGSAIKTGFKKGLTGIVDIIKNEIGHIINAIGERIDDAKNKAIELGNAIVSGVREAIDPGSPGIIARSIIGNEFGTYIPQVISDNGDMAFTSAQYYGEQIKEGISSVNTDSLNLDTAIGNYETDAQMIATSSQMMGMETSTAFNDMSLAVNTTTSTMAGNVGSTYSQMQQKQSSSLQSMKTQNQTAYHEMYLKSNQSLIQMRDSTSNITQQMISAWSHMKTQLVATANQLRNESTSHFNRLSETIGSFYRKIQNPSNWGAGTGSSTPVRSRRNTTAGRSFARGMRTRTSLHGAGTSSTYTGSKYMTIGSLKKKLCPDGSCGYLFDGFNSSDKVNVEEFLASITGEHGFGWSGWDKTHYNYIKNTSDQWSMKSPVIQVVGGVPTNANFKVGDFENGTPSISFDSFKSMAEAIFTAIPYRHYMDSSWKGSWLGAIQSGACNCSDGAEAIIAFASACGFGGGQKVHGYWGNEGHFWAVINGEVFDTTAMQKGYGWRSPSVHGYGTKVRTTVSSGEAPSTGNKTFNITVNINEPVYGVDDLDTKIQDSVNKGLQREFNDPYSVAL